MITHIVMFKFKEQNRDKNILEAKKILNSLQETIPTLISIEVGITICVIIQFLLMINY
nr:Dabb family protein [Sulfurovaceae bacterium]